MNLIDTRPIPPPKNRHNTAHFVSILDTLCRFHVDFVSIFVNNTTTAFIGNQQLAKI